MKNTLAIVAFLLFSSSALAYDCPITLSQHSTDKNTLEKPARFAYTNSQAEDVSDKDRETYAIDAALSIRCATRSIDYMLGVEFHKNDLTKKATDTSALRGGFVFNRLAENNFSLLVSGGYLNDEVKDEESFQALADMEFLYEDWFINERYKIGNNVFLFSPVVAFEFERVFEDPEDETGNAVRLMYGLSASYYFSKSETVGYRFVIGTNYTHWNYLSKDDELNLSNNDELIIATFSWILTKSENHEVALQYKYQDGRDPRNKISENTFDEVAVTVKYKFE